MSPSYSDDNNNLCGGNDAEEWKRAMSSCNASTSEDNSGMGLYRFDLMRVNDTFLIRYCDYHPWDKNRILWECNWQSEIPNGAPVSDRWCKVLRRAPTQSQWRQLVLQLEPHCLLQYKTTLFCVKMENDTPRKRDPDLYWWLKKVHHESEQQWGRGLFFRFTCLGKDKTTCSL